MKISDGDMGMQFEVSGKKCRLLFDNPSNYKEVASHFLSDSVVSGAFTSFVQGLNYNRYTEEKFMIGGGSMGDADVGRIVDAYFNGDDIENVISSIGVGKSIPAFLGEIDGFDFVDKSIIDFYETFVATYGLIDSSARSELKAALMTAASDYIIDMMKSLDKSTYRDLFEIDETVELVFVPSSCRSKFSGFIDSRSVVNVSDVDSELTLVMDDEALNLLKLLNVSASDFVDFLKDKSGFDVLNSHNNIGLISQKCTRFRDNLEAWKFVCDVESKTPVSSDFNYPVWLKDEKYRNHISSIARVLLDDSRPPAISMESLCTILENPSDGGVATYNFEGNVRALLSGEYGKPFIAQGGRVGLHNFGEDSGYLTAVDSEILVDVRSGEIFAESGLANPPCDTYHTEPGVMTTTTKPYHLSGLVQRDNNNWRSSDIREDGGYLEIELNPDIAFDGKDAYWVTAHFPDGSQNTSSEIFNPQYAMESVEDEVRRLMASTDKWGCKMENNPKISM